MSSRLIARDGRLRVVVRATHLADRACGGCTSCCHAMRVDELHKPAGAPCRHARATRGCAAYADRPESCREFQCLWLRGLRGTTPDHRPDRVGLMLIPTTEPRTIDAVETRPGASTEVDAMFLLHALRDAGLTVRIVPHGAETAAVTPVTISGHRLKG